MDKYLIQTANMGSVEYFTEHPLKGDGWTAEAELDETGKVSDSEVKLVAPSGVGIGRYRITPATPGELRRAIEKHLKRAELGPAQAGPHRFAYQGTTGDPEAARRVSVIQTEDWSLRVDHLQGANPEWIQIVADGGLTVVANVPVDQMIGLHDRLRKAINDYRQAKGAPPPATPTPLICIDKMPTGSWCVSLWLSGEQHKSLPGENGSDDFFGASRNPAGYADMLKRIDEWLIRYPGARIQSPELELEEIRRMVAAQPAAEQPVMAGSQPEEHTEPGRPEWVSCEACGEVHRVNWSPAEWSPHMSRCKSCTGERFVPCGPPAAAEGAPGVINPKLVVGPVKTAAEPTAQVGAAVMEPVSPPAAEQPGAPVEYMLRIPVDQIVMGTNQRSHYDHDKLLELADSIRTNGVRQPILVTLRDGQYRLTAGARRLLASRMANVPDIPAVIREQSVTDDKADQLIENIQREDISPIDEARAYRELQELIGGTPGDVAARVGRSRTHVVEYLSLLDLPNDLQHQAATGAMGVKAAIAYLRRTADDPEHVKAKVAQVMVDERPSTREAERVIERVRQEEGVARATPPKETPAPRGSQLNPGIPDQPTNPTAPSPEPERVPAPDLPNPEPQAPVAPTPPATVDPAIERAMELAEIGRQVGPDATDDKVWPIWRQSYITPAALGDHWDARKKLDSCLPESFGQMKVQIPTQGVWLAGPELPDEKIGPRSTLMVSNGLLWVRVTGGRIACRVPDEPVYYRVAVEQVEDTGNGVYRVIVHQVVVVGDVDRQVVIGGNSKLMITIDELEAWKELLQDLPAVPVLDVGGDSGGEGT